MTVATRAIDPGVDPKEKLIIALDVSSAVAARSIVEELRGNVGAFKIGLQLFTAAGPEFVREAAAAGEKIFLDLKFHDIPNTVANAAVEAARLGVWMLNVHCAGGSEMLKRTVQDVNEVCGRDGIPVPHIIGVTVLTSSDADTLAEIGVESIVEDQACRLARLAADCGLDGVVASAREAASIRAAVNLNKFMIVTPGIRPVSATNDDQRRVTTFAQALDNGSDYVVIGRPVTAANDRRGAVADILDELR